ncbi:thioredoxin fold domain-containing protein [Alphaproteobacteria bacterium GH1-50]|uniref:Thioredoxin fold domain-containing protein n=1 Tax=Kangsaoukella pontilimi TaxID=2691042 RepID=A0A7C9MCC4_9RHOB|nr:thioredoxin family protein [Kangsaoukella pontilimi]MXQ07471.1 thioredoxin fold domain-containing protein [Kangsaoukella pontilimi]
MRRLIAALFAVLIASAAQAVEMGDDGLHKPDWLRETFKDLQEDRAEAEAEGKRLMIIVEQRGCSYCREMHEKTFTDPRVKSMLEEDYFPVQVNLHGDLEIVDIDGEVLSEKAATRKWGVLFTPTMILLPMEVSDDASAAAQAAAVMPGAFSASTTLDLLTWVKEERYLDQSEEDFQRYHARMVSERGGEGID